MISFICEGNYEPLPFFICFFLITGIIHVITLKSKARELLRNILQDKNHDI
ncbi:hypothetical protein MuYL_0495 [Mucilaginibacter xinganensis]|uniref:Uncharacterized protein n=2 Tax=Mucilaginibacter xinganensis TaxID=1234841 RepID=A0A223NRW7_9SPHI|nr:hypothetical protein MuYL_0495 [Mucilaginibacter xinganensis]